MYNFIINKNYIKKFKKINKGRYNSHYIKECKKVAKIPLPSLNQMYQETKINKPCDGNVTV